MSNNTIKRIQEKLAFCSPCSEQPLILTGARMRSGEEERDVSQESGLEFGYISGGACSEFECNDRGDCQIGVVVGSIPVWAL